MAEADNVTEQRDTLCIDLTLLSSKFDDKRQCRSKNTLGRSVPVKTMTDVHVKDDRTSEDGSPRPVYIKKTLYLYTLE